MEHSFLNKSSGYLWYISFIAAFGGFLFGYDVIVVSGVIPQVVSQFELTSFQLGFLVSCVLWGCAIGSVISGFILDSFGRKRVLVTSAFTILVSAIWSGLASSPELLIVARLLGGIGCGIATTTCPLYISEVSPEKKRGKMVTLYHFAVCLGIVFCVFVNWAIYLVSRSHIGCTSHFFLDQSWRAMFTAEAIPASLFMIFSLSLPESPRWLVQRNRAKEARTLLERINGKEKALSIATEIHSSIHSERKATFSSLFTREIRKPLVLGILLSIFAEASGISVVLYYGPQLFEQAGLNLGTALGGFSIIAIINLLFNLVAMRYIDRSGRRKVLIVGSAGTMVSLILIGLLYLNGQTGILIILCVIAFVAFFSSSIGPVKFVIISEIFPSEFRAKAVSLCILFVWLTSAAVAQLFPMMREVMHTGSIFFIFALDTLALLVVAVFLLPETKGLTIEETGLLWFPRKESEGIKQ